MGSVRRLRLARSISYEAGDLVFLSLVGPLWLRFVRREVVRVSLVVYRVIGIGISRLSSRLGPLVSSPYLTTTGSIRLTSGGLISVVLSMMARLAIAEVWVILSAAAIFLGRKARRIVILVVTRVTALTVILVRLLLVVVIGLFLRVVS